MTEELPSPLCSCGGGAEPGRQKAERPLCLAPLQREAACCGLEVVQDRDPAWRRLPPGTGVDTCCPARRVAWVSPEAT